MPIVNTEVDKMINKKQMKLTAFENKRIRETFMTKKKEMIVNLPSSNLSKQNPVNKEETRDYVEIHEPNPVC